MMTLLTQAAAEYMGVAFQSAMRSVGTGLQSAGRYVEQNPLVVAGVVLGLLVVVRMLTRKRR